MAFLMGFHVCRPLLPEPAVHNRLGDHARLLAGGGAALRMPTDIFPEINIPVVSVVWTYNGMSADEMQNRIVSMHERQLASLVDNIEHIEANSYQGVGVIRVYLQDGSDVSRAVSQLASSAWWC